MLSGPNTSTSSGCLANTPSYRPHLFPVFNALESRCVFISQYRTSTRNQNLFYQVSMLLHLQVPLHFSNDHVLILWAWPCCNFIILPTSVFFFFCSSKPIENRKLLPSQFPQHYVVITAIT